MSSFSEHHTRKAQHHSAAKQVCLNIATLPLCVVGMHSRCISKYAIECPEEDHPYDTWETDESQRPEGDTRPLFAAGSVNGSPYCSISIVLRHELHARSFIRWKFMRPVPRPPPRPI